jgi:CheY-like chemotaxis protein
MPSRSSSPASLRATPELVGAHILVVDDRPNDLRLLTEILRSARCRISVAFDGLQAYHRAQAIVPDLILMDVRMPAWTASPRAGCWRRRPTRRTFRSSS